MIDTAILDAIVALAEEYPATEPERCPGGRPEEIPGMDRTPHSVEVLELLRA